MIKELGQIKEEEKLAKFVKKNRKDVDKSTGFSRYLITYQNDGAFEAVEYFYLETPNIPAKNFPIKVYGIFDRITIEQEKRNRIKEDIIKILAEVKKFGVYLPVQEATTSKTKKKKE